MSDKVKTGSYDIQAVVILSTIFFLLIIFLPQLTVPRILLGLPFLLFFPGYALVSLMYPRIDVKEEPNEEKEKSRKTKKMDFRSKSKETEKETKENKGEEQTPKRKASTITLPKRISLAFALSLGISPVLGYLLNELYLVNDSIFRLDTLQEVVILYIFIIVICILAVVRRERYPKNERFQMTIKYRNPLGDTQEDQAITLILVLLILASSITGLYLYSNYHSKDRFTEFYIFGENREIGDYPRLFHVDTPQMIYLGVKNTEFKKMNYSIEIGLLGGIPRVFENISSNLTLTEGIQYSQNITLDHNEELLSTLNLTLPESGTYDIIFQLVAKRKIYRTLNLKVSAFERNDLKYARDGSITAFFTGTDGAVSSVENLVSSNENYSFALTIINELEHSVGTNTTIGISSYPGVWTDHLNNENVSYVNLNNGIFIHRRIDEDHHITNIFNFRLPRGRWDLIILVEFSSWTVNFNRTVEVY